MENKILSGKSAVVTGGTTGIGKAVASELASLGAKVLICGRDKNDLSRALEEISRVGEVHGISADISSRKEVLRIFAEADRLFGTLDILVNNAGVGGRSILNTETEKMEKIISINLIGYMLCTLEAAKRMIRGSIIVNVGSLSSKVKEEDADIYVASKSGVEGFTESIRKQLNRKGIKVSLIQPGNVGTDMVTEPKEEQKKLHEKGLMLDPADIARSIMFCIEQPPGCTIDVIQVRPAMQIL